MTALTASGRHALRLVTNRDGPALNSPTLATLAVAAGKIFGTSIDPAYFPSTDWSTYVQNEVATNGIVTTEAAFNFTTVEPSHGTFSYTTPQACVTLAGTLGIPIRGHMLIDATQTGTWVATTVNAGNWQTILAAHIAAVCGHFAGQMHSYDVVNECLKPFSGSDANGFITNPWYTAGGIGANGVPNYIPYACQQVRLADPTAKIVLNFDWLETSEVSQGMLRQKANILQLLTNLVNAGIPIDAAGLECHLNFNFSTNFVASDWTAFLTAIQALGLAVFITELDVNDSAQATDDATRDAQDAAVYTQFLTPTLAHPAVQIVQVWQMSDRDSWMNRGFGAQRTDGLKLRPNVLDGEYRPKLAYQAFANALIAAALPGGGGGLPPGPVNAVPNPPSVTFTDELGLVTMQTIVPTLGSWMPDQIDVGTPAVGLGTGDTFLFPYRTDFVVACDLAYIASWNESLFMRLRSWLRRGGTCVLFTADAAGRMYTCKLWPGKDITWSYDPKEAEYTIHLNLANAAAGRMICSYGSVTVAA